MFRLPLPVELIPPRGLSTEDCSSGRPATCNIGCARVVLPFFEDCGPALGPLASAFNDIVGKCQTTETTSYTINGQQCAAENVVVLNQGCERGSPHYDAEGMACANDGTAQEAHCS